MDKNNFFCKKLFNDPEFKNGFNVRRLINGPDGRIPIGTFTYPGAVGEPKWSLVQWYSKHCLIGEREKTDEYTISDKAGSKTVIYSPKDNSVSMRLNARRVYDGKPHTDGLWPHLLLEQNPICIYGSLDENDRRFYRTDCDKMFFETDIRMSAFENTSNAEGINACQFMAYFYLTPINLDRFIWFGVNFFDSRKPADTYWNIDTVGTEMIYCLSCADTYGGLENSFYDEKGNPSPTEEWKHIELDLTPHIDKVIELANRDGVFSREVGRSDFYIRGTNVGFETHGNFDCTFDIKNYNIASYIRKSKQ